MAEWKRAGVARFVTLPPWNEVAPMGQCSGMSAERAERTAPGGESELARG
jgi:hypothetical protein